MSPELSSNWKKLQGKIQAESTRTSAKRKADDNTQDPHGKRRKFKTGSSATKATKAVRPKGHMGAAQSVVTGAMPKTAVSPSLALWAEDNDISPEDVVEAYGLGLESRPGRLAEESSRPNEGLATGIEVGKYVALDCEMVGVGDGAHQSALARLSVVDFLGRQVYDSFVRPQEKVTDWRTHVSGVSPKDMATARTFQEVQADVAKLLKGRIMIGHDVKHDLQALMLDHPARSIRDTAKFPGFKKYGHGPKPSLRVLAREILGLDIQNGQHSSIEDARVTMLLFRKHKSAFDNHHMSRFPDSAPKSSRPHGNGKKAKKAEKAKKMRRS